jgi:hypothetical protein
MVSKQNRENWSKSTWFQQYSLNFLGSLTGWAALAFVIYRVILDGSLHKFEGWDALGILVALLGITGHLPMFILQIVNWRSGLPGSGS